VKAAGAQAVSARTGRHRGDDGLSDGQAGVVGCLADDSREFQPGHVRRLLADLIPAAGDEGVHETDASRRHLDQHGVAVRPRWDGHIVDPQRIGAGQLVHKQGSHSVRSCQAKAEMPVTSRPMIISTIA